MLRTALLLSLLAACNASQASKLDEKPAPARNLVCERVALLSPKATCVAELSGQGDLATHTARVTPEGAKQAIVCGLNAGQLSMACGTLEVQPVAKPDTLTTTESPKAEAPKAAKK